MRDKVLGEALTFDDVLLVPSYSDFLPKEADTTCRLTKNIKLNIPLVAAAMDTVTESDLAIALAREGGIGIVHKNMSIDKQVEEVDRVKRSESGMIYNPITLTSDRPIGEALVLMRRYKISGIPIVDGQKLVGILTNRDLRFEIEQDLRIREVMTSRGLVTAPMGTTLEQAEQILQKNRIEKLPVVDEMDRVMEATTLPTLLLGGDPTDPGEAFASWEKALGLPSVRGLIVGRTLLYPPDDDVASAVATAVSLVR